MIITEQINEALRSIEKERGATEEQPGAAAKEWLEYYGKEKPTDTNTGKSLDGGTDTPNRCKLTGKQI
ncbi:MAG: hypothetical protein IJ553_05270 [Alloprevotella sp.]|nr:hypothetical protein [Alloprevotella sp.]